LRVTAASSTEGANPAGMENFVLEGCITVGWEEAGHTVEERLGPKDVILTPAGRVHYFRNDGVADAEFMLLVGSARAEDVRFQAA
jgi:oxalate decarboxylase/phosphoglucose isomerase-like protein (cupin superfamily)